MRRILYFEEKLRLGGIWVRRSGIKVILPEDAIAPGMATKADPLINQLRKSLLLVRWARAIPLYLEPRRLINSVEEVKRKWEI